jgi:hypothetical protein
MNPYTQSGWGSLQQPFFLFGLRAPGGRCGTAFCFSWNRCRTGHNLKTTEPKDI